MPTRTAAHPNGGDPMADGALARPVLIGCSHGTSDPAGRRTIRALLDAIAAARPELDVREAFVDVQQPEVAAVVAEAQTDAPAGPPVVVVPLLLSGGYHVHVDIAAAVAGGRALAAAPLGPDPRLAALLDERLTEAGARVDDAVVLAAAGSSDRRAADDVEHVARELQSQRRGPVTVGYGAGCDPSVPQAVAAARRGGAQRVVVAAYLLAPGFFHDRLQAAGADLVTAPLAPHPTLVAMALDRYAAARRSAVAGS